MAKELRRKVEKKWHGPCIYKVREVSSPLHKEHRGFRFIVAVPNMNGHKPFSDLPAASFTKAYQLFQSSDYNGEDLEKKIPAHIQWLKNRGFTVVEPAEVYEDRMILEMAKNHRKTDQHLLEQELNEGDDA